MVGRGMPRPYDRYEIMARMWWIVALAVLFAAALVAFIVIARKGRALRTSQPLPPEATRAHLEWNENGSERTMEIETPFYAGKSAESQIVLPGARAEFEACIFTHNHRFAFQTLPGASRL